MKKLLTIMLSLVMLFTMSATVFAAESSANTISGIVITENSESVRVAEVVDEEYRYVFTYDKENNTMTSERFNLDNELEVTAVVNVNDETIYNPKTNTTFLGGCSTGFAIGAGPAGWGIAVSGYLAAAGFGVAAQATATEIGEWQATALARYTDVKNESSIYF